MSDVLDLLQPKTDVLVRMETLRRASVYSTKDPALAYELLGHLQARVLAAETAGVHDALGWFDAGYFVESMKQFGFIHREESARVFSSIDGYDWIRRAIELTGGSPAMEFAAALANHSRPNGHLKTAYRLAAKGSLVRRNLESHFPQNPR